MEDRGSGRIIAALAAIGSVPLAGLTLYTLTIALGDVQLLLSSRALETIAPEMGPVIGLGMLADTFGYYLLYIPVISYLWIALYDHNPGLIIVGALMGVIYIVMGAVGAIVQWSVLPVLIESYVSTGGAAKAGLEATWIATTHATTGGLWRIEALPAAIWMLFMGQCLRQAQFLTGFLAQIIGTIWLIAFVGTIMALGPVESMAQFAAIVLMPIWALLLGLLLLIRPLER